MMTIDEYIQTVPDARKEAFSRLRKVIKENIPDGFIEEINYGMIGYVVPHSIYPDGYHCNPKDPLPFINLASQKGSINLYHMGLYADETLMKWFTEEYGKIAKHKIDMGKSCIRFKYMEEIPYELIANLVKRINVQEWIKRYKETFRK